MDATEEEKNEDKCDAREEQKKEGGCLADFNHKQSALNRNNSDFLKNTGVDTIDDPVSKRDKTTEV